MSKKGFEDFKSSRKILSFSPEVRMRIHNNTGKKTLTPEKFWSNVQKNTEAMNDAAKK